MGERGEGELGKGVFDQLISIILWQIFIFEVALDLISPLIFLCPENVAKFNISAIRPSNPIQLYKIELNAVCSFRITILSPMSRLQRGLL